MNLQKDDVVFAKCWGKYCVVKNAYKSSTFCTTVEFEDNVCICAEDCCTKQSLTKIIVSHFDFVRLKKIHGIGRYYHDLTPTYDKLCIKPTKFIMFRDLETKETITIHLGSATRVLKKIGIIHNGNYQPVRVAKPMVKLQLIGEL